MDKINIKKIAVIGLATAVLFLGLTMVTPVKKAAAETVEELQAQIQALLQQIAQLQNQLAALQGETPSETSTSDYCYNFTRNLTIGSTGDDVKALQRILISEGVWTTPSVGATGYFGPITKNSLAAFQDKHAAEILIPLGLTKGTGYFGPSTRSYIASQCSVAPTPSPSPSPGASPTPSPSPTAEGLTVEVAADNPAAATIPDGSLYNPMLKINLTAGSSDVTVDSITVTRGGIIANTYVTGVSIWDEEGNRLGNIVESLTDDGKATIDLGEDKITIPAGQTKAVIVKANISGEAGSGTINFSINSASDISTEEDVTINGSFPIIGNTMGIVDGEDSLGDVKIEAQSVSGLDWDNISSADGNVEVGDQDKEVYKVKLNQENSSEAIQLEQLTVYVEGTIEESSDVTNWRLYAPDGTLLASADKPVDRFVTFKLDTPYVIDKGLSKTLSVKVDITDGSQHYFRVYIQNDYDILVRGVTTGSYVEPFTQGTGSNKSFNRNDTRKENSGFKIKEGVLTVSKASDCPSGNVAPGATDIVLAKFDLKSSGEKLQVRKMGIQIKYASGGTELTGTVKVKDAETGTTYLSLSASTDGLQTTSEPNDSTLSTYQRNLSSYITIPSGETKTIEIVGSVSSSANNSDEYDVYVGQFYGKRYSSNDYTTLAEGPYHGNTLGVTDVVLTVTRNNAFAYNTTRAIGATDVKIGEYIFQASSADDIKINSISLAVTGSTSTSGGYGHLAIQNMKLKDEDGNQLGSTIGTPSDKGNSFSVDLTIPKSESKIISVYADILSSAGKDNTVQTQVEASGVSGYGVSSSKDISTGNVNGQMIKLQTGEVTIKKDADAPSSQIIVADSSGVELNKISFEAKNEDLTLKKITLQLVNASTSQSVDKIAQNISRVYLYDGSELLNAAGTPVGEDGKITISGLNVTLPQDQTKALTVKADITSSGTLTPTSVGGIKVYSTTTADFTDYLEIYSAQGVMSTSSVSIDDYAQSNYFLFTDAAPSVAVDSDYKGTKQGNSSAQETVTKITVTNTGEREITLSDIRLIAQIAGVKATTTNYISDFRLYAEDGSTQLSTSTLYSDKDFSVTTNQLDGVTSTVYVRFDSMDPTQVIAANNSKTFVIKANTLHVEDGIENPGSNTAKLSLQIGGEKGYDNSNTSSELYWKDGYITYSYTPVNGSEISELNASDSVQVDLTTLTY